VTEGRGGGGSLLPTPVWLVLGAAVGGAIGNGGGGSAAGLVLGLLIGGAAGVGVATALGRRG
jgi:hypothetical protein